jgi:hypothetical protein
MNLKTLGLTISLISAGWLGASEAASAAKFEQDDFLNMTIPFFQINAAGLPNVYDPLLNGETSGGTDGLVDALFGKRGTILPNSPNDRVINKVGTTDDVVPGDLGEFLVTSGSTGFQNYNDQYGLIRSFDGSEFAELDEVNGGFNPANANSNIANEFPNGIFPDNFFLKLGDPNEEVYLYMTEIDSFDLTGALTGNGFITLVAKGWMIAVGDDENVDFYNVEYEFSSQGLRDNGSVPDVVEDDGVSGAVSASAVSLVISVNRQQGPNVPEPSAIIGLSVVAGAGLLMKKKKLVQNK